MKYLPLIGTVLGIAQALIAKNPVAIGLGIMLVLLVGPALCGQIYDITPLAKRKAKQQQTDLENALEYAKFVNYVYLHPTVPNMRKLDRSGLREKIVKLRERNNLFAYKAAIDCSGGWKKHNAFLRKVDDSKRSEEWKVLDDLGIDENS